MKHLCCSRVLISFFVLVGMLHASLTQKSAIVYFGKDISYSMVGIHDYIIVDPKNINEYRHGFRLYNNKIYAKISEISSLKKLKKRIKYLEKKGYRNFYFDYKSIDVNKKVFIKYIKQLSKDNVKIILRAKKDIVNKLKHNIIAIIVYKALNKVNQKYTSNFFDIIDIEDQDILSNKDIEQEKQKIIKRGMIPYIANNKLTIYGISSKTAIKREILTLINEKSLDRIFQVAHRLGAMPLEYQGYIQKLFDVSKGLPNLENIEHYAGVIIWISSNYKDPNELFSWVNSVIEKGIKVVFVGSFGTAVDGMLLKELEIDVYDGERIENNKKIITYRDPIVGFEIEPSLSDENIFLQPQNAQPILTYEDVNGLKSSPAAITQWGGYVLYESLFVELYGENMWIINPFEFFRRALRLKPLIVPDTTTQNGNRLMFSHVDGDGIMNYVASAPNLYSGDIIREKILKKYSVPHSVSIIGAEIDDNGLFPKIAKKLQLVAKKIFALSNVEPATHTFTHPFFWSKIKNDNLPDKYRLKVKGYHFSIARELELSLDEINVNYIPKNKKRVAKTVFWSGDCAPRTDALEHIYRNHLLNINGGDTDISNAHPWLSNVAPMGLERGGYYQIYTGAQNENIFTNNWLGPFWGFKKVVQTFKLTDKPRRLKPIDIYYHLYSGSKVAAVNALKYVFDWSLKQDVLPIYTSEYIPKVMDYYDISIANEENYWLFDGMDNLKTLRIEAQNVGITLNEDVLGRREIDNHTYIALYGGKKHLLHLTKMYDKESYLVSSNAEVKKYNIFEDRKEFLFDGYLDLKLKFHITSNCELYSDPKEFKRVKNGEFVKLFYKHNKRAKIDVICK